MPSIYVSTRLPLLARKARGTGVITLDALSLTNTFGGSASAKNASHVLGSGSNRLVVVTAVMRAQTLSSMTYDGTPMSLVTGFPIDSGGVPNLRAYIYYLLNASLPPAGTYNLTATPTGSSGYGAFGCISVFGARQAEPEAIGSGSSTSSTASWANNITTLTKGAWIFEVSQSYDRVFTPDGSQTEMFDLKDGTNTSMGASRKEFATAEATTMGQTLDTPGPYAQAIAAFAPA